MKFYVYCIILSGILIFSSFGCVLGSENVMNINKINSSNDLLNSVGNNLKTINKSIIFVDQTRGNDANPGTLEKPKKSLKSAVDTVANNGTINVANGQYNGNDNINLIINKTIHINGQGASSTTINGNSNQICSVVAGNTVFISGFNFLNGKNDQGGAINNLGNLNIDNCVFTDNVGSVGGAIYNKNNLNIASCNFTNNHVNQGNGLGGAIYTRQGKCSVAGTVFENNTAIGDGGAINNNYNGNLILVNNQFHSNAAKTAGAISNGYNCDIKSCTFNQNTADMMGGAIYSMGNLNIDNSQFTENIASYDLGGAIGTGSIDSGSVVNISNSIFDKNRAKNYGAVYSVATLNIKKSQFNKNHADEDGGAVGSSGNLDIQNTDFTFNTADRHGGAVIGSGGFNNLKNSNYINNSACHIGGAVCISSSNNIDGNNFTNNSAYHGGAIYNGFKGDTSCQFYQIKNNNFIKNTAKELGGAIVNSGVGTLSNNNFTWNKIAKYPGLGGAIFSNNGTLNLNDNNFEINFVSTEESTGDPDGGGIANVGDSHIHISGSKTHFMDSNIYNEACLDIKDCTIEKNCDDGRHLNNQNAKRFSESNITIKDSPHAYETPGSNVYIINIPLKVEIKKGESTKITAKLIRQFSSPIIFIGNEVDYFSELVMFSIYNNEGYMEVFPYDNKLCRGTLEYTNLKGQADRIISTDNMNPGDYRIQIYTEGKMGFGWGAKPCIRTIDLTVLP